MPRTTPGAATSATNTTASRISTGECGEPCASTEATIAAAAANATSASVRTAAATARASGAIRRSAASTTARSGGGAAVRVRWWTARLRAVHRDFLDQLVVGIADGAAPVVRPELLPIGRIVRRALVVFRRILDLVLRPVD